jgi:glycosyltransferase involved in cell wall biosynthesis
VVNQECDFAFEIVVGEDSSPDSTRAIILEYQQKYPDLIRLMPEAPNKGLMKNFRDTLAACKGKYLTICAGDDFWHDPKKLQKQVNFLEANPDYGLVHTDANMYNEKNKTTIESYNKKNQPGIIDGHVFEALLTSRFFIFSLTTCFRRSLYEKHIDFEDYFRHGFIYEDLPTWLELSTKTKFKYLPESMATYRVNENSASNSTDIQKKFAFLQAHYSIKRYYIDKYKVSPEVEKEFEVIYHQRRFNLAYTWNNYAEAATSYGQLKERNSTTSRLWLKKTVLSMPFVYRSFKKLKKGAVS